MIGIVEFRKKFGDLEVHCDRDAPGQLRCDFIKKDGDQIHKANVVFNSNTEGGVDMTSLKGDANLIIEGAKLIQKHLTVDLK